MDEKEKIDKFMKNMEEREGIETLVADGIENKKISDATEKALMSLPRLLNSGFGLRTLSASNGEQIFVVDITCAVYSPTGNHEVLAVVPIAFETFDDVMAAISAISKVSPLLTRRAIVADMAIQTFLLQQSAEAEQGQEQVVDTIGEVAGHA